MIICLIANGRSIHTQRWAEYFTQKGPEIHLITYYLMNRTIHGVTEHVITSRWKNHSFLHPPPYRNKKTRKKMGIVPF